jgi:CubicO group peptidase (beta-lactamase class C family)
MTLHRPLALMLLLADAAHAASPQSLPPSAHMAQCEALGLSSCPQPFDAILPPAEDMLSWDQRSRVVGFRNTYRLYQGDVFRTLGGKAYPLPGALHPMPVVHYHMQGRTYDLAGYLRRQDVTGLLILKDGRIAYEYYGGGNSDKTLWTSRSVAKSVVSILIGMAIKEGMIGSVDDPITRYLPELEGSAWDGVNLHDLMRHTSGVAWNENYTDPTSDFAHLTRCEASPAPYDCVMQLVSTLKRMPGVRPGEVWSYNTGGAWLVGRVLEKATGMTIAHYLETRLWSRFAMQSDGVWEALIKGHADMGGHGFNAILRDWGRFALFVAEGGKLPSGEELLPSNWIAQSVMWTKAKGSVTPAAPEGQYGYQWWFGGVDPSLQDTDDAAQTARQSFWAEGIYGQAIAINPIEKLVMVQWSTWKQAETPPSLYDEQALFFNALAHALGHPSTTAAAAATADGSPSSEPAPFVREWRAVMSTGEAKLLPYAGSAFKIERRPISATQLDRLEALLLPMLAAELKSKGSRNPPSSYFRQYAAARSGKHQVILVHGYLRDTGHSIDWTRKPVDANNGGQSFWDAVYVVKRHQFAKLKHDGSAVRHTVIFQRAA